MAVGRGKSKERKVEDFPIKLRTLEVEMIGESEEKKNLKAQSAFEIGAKDKILAADLTIPVMYSLRLVVEMTRGARSIIKTTRLGRGIFMDSEIDRRGSFFLFAD